MRLFYTWGIYCYRFAIGVASLFNVKAKSWITGRRKLFKLLAEQKEINGSIWFHAASLGEFEQGRPIIEKIKEYHPEKKILLTFFSPSGFEIRKNYEYADFVLYLPLDTIRNAQRFIKLSKPSMVFFVKYEFWFNFLHILKKNNVPTFLISGIFRKEQHFFKWYGKWFRKQLRVFDAFFVQNHESLSLLKNIGFENAILSGDTRYDRVYQISQNPKKFPLIEKFCDAQKVVVAGSTWSEDEDLLAQYIKENKGVRFIIAPHNTDEWHIQQIQNKIQLPSIRYSKLDEENVNKYNVLIIDSIGILAHLYQFAHIAYIGGGFGKGIHNVLEAATFNKPIVFGPKYHKFYEAKQLVEVQAAFSVNNYEQLRYSLNLLIEDKAFYNTSSQNALKIVEQNIGATQKIMEIIKSAL